MIVYDIVLFVFFFFKQKTAYEMRISDWSSDVCSSDLLTVLRADEDTRFLVVEMGARGIGHIDYLCGITRPDIAAVINVGTAHMSEFGSREAARKSVV